MVIVSSGGIIMDRWSSSATSAARGSRCPRCAIEAVCGRLSRMAEVARLVDLVTLVSGARAIVGRSTSPRDEGGSCLCLLPRL